MKKTFFLIILLFAVSSSFAQEDLFEGYADFKWGATVSEVKAKFPSMSDETTAEDRKAEESLYVYEAGNFTRVFRFYKDKLYWGRTIYDEPEDATVSAIVRKLSSSYGHYDDTDEYTQDKYEGTTYNWKKTLTFWVELDLRDYYVWDSEDGKKNLDVSFKTTNHDFMPEKALKNDWCCAIFYSFDYNKKICTGIQLTDVIER